MLRIRLIFAAVLALSAVALTVSVKSRASTAPVELIPQAPPPVGLAILSSSEHTIESGETFGAIMRANGVSGVQAILDAAKPHFDLSRIRAGKSISFGFFEPDHTPYRFTYPIDEERTLVVNLNAGGPVAELQEVVYTERMTTRSFQVNSSLWEAATNEGLRSSDIARLAQIFQWDVDFARELRQGARFTLVANQLMNGAEAVKFGEIFAVRLENNGRTYEAIHHTLSNGDEGWYAPDGTASKRPFLRSPLEFSRVTSNFNPRRYHPVLGRTRAHNGTDYGAPTGTPIRAVGDGVVNFSGRKGGYGNFVSIDHAGPYETRYAHLNRIRVRNGQRVKQGDIIGTVGQTGLATGPHLHFEFKVRGNFVDPVTVDVPTAEPLPRSERAAFFEVRDIWHPILEDAAAPAVASVE